MDTRRVSFPQYKPHGLGKMGNFDAIYPVATLHFRHRAVPRAIGARKFLAPWDAYRKKNLGKPNNNRSINKKTTSRIQRTADKSESPGRFANCDSVGKAGIFRSTGHSFVI